MTDRLTKAVDLHLRDWFAGHALAAQMARPGGDTVEEAAVRAYEYADAMMEARTRVDTRSRA